MFRHDHNTPQRRKVWVQKKCLTKLTSFKGKSVCIKNSEAEVKPTFKKLCTNEVNW